MSDLESPPGEILLFDKPLTWTSFDVVKKVRGALKIKKVGHAGTLDPLATGLLILCTGKYTKRINEIQGLPKEYTGTITLGMTTDSEDLETEPVYSGDAAIITSEQIGSAALKLTGKLMQRPPLHSAKWVDGKRAYVLARQGSDHKLNPVEIEVHSFEISKIDLPIIHFKVNCSKGTYIRSLARDMGELLGCGAHLSSLRRTAIGQYAVSDAHDVVSFCKQAIELRRSNGTA